MISEVGMRSRKESFIRERENHSGEQSRHRKSGDEWSEISSEMEKN